MMDNIVFHHPVQNTCVGKLQNGAFIEPESLVLYGITSKLGTILSYIILYKPHDWGRSQSGYFGPD